MRWLALILLCLTLSCAGTGAAAQDGAMTGTGAAGGAAFAAATGGSTLVIAAAAFVGSFIMSLLDQAAEGQVAIEELAPMGIRPLISHFFWFIVWAFAIVATLFWFLPGPFRMLAGVVKAVLRGAGKAARAAKKNMNDEPPTPPGTGGAYGGPGDI